MNEVEIFTTTGLQTEIAVRFEGETAWLTQAQMAALFNQTKQNVSLHINNCYKEGELNKEATVKKSLTVQKEAGRSIKRNLEFYNLDVIISVGYRVKSKQGTQFRQWATQRLQDYLVKGYALNEKRLREAESHFNELKKAIGLVQKVTNTKNFSGSEAHGLLKVLGDFAVALDILDRYDHQQLTVGQSTSGL